MITLLPFLAALLPADAPRSPSELIRDALPRLIEMQEEGGEWPYEGVYRVNGEIPVGYRIGGTSIVATTLLVLGAPGGDVQRAIDRALEFVLKELDHPLMRPSTEPAYDVRVWGHAYALEFLCRIRAARRAAGHADEIDQWIPRLVGALLTEELPGGGWNYARSGAQHASFVTAPVTQALLLARDQHERVPDEVLVRARDVLKGSRVESGAFLYSGLLRGGSDGGARAKIPGSIARAPICETTLMLLGVGSTDAIHSSLDAFFEHWDELEKRRKQKGTHAGPYGIAPYYFYYGHRYAAQAIEMLPEAERAAQRTRLLEFILRTRDDDGTWNDREFARSRNFGTAMIVLALLGERAPLPPVSGPLNENAAAPAPDSSVTTRPASDGNQKQLR